jgi:hypothetical protein
MGVGFVVAPFRIVDPDRRISRIDELLLFPFPVWMTAIIPIGEHAFGELTVAANLMAFWLFHSTQYESVMGDAPRIERIYDHIQAKCSLIGSTVDSVSVFYRDHSTLDTGFVSMCIPRSKRGVAETIAIYDVMMINRPQQNYTIANHKYIQDFGKIDLLVPAKDRINISIMQFEKMEHEINAEMPEQKSRRSRKGLEESLRLRYEGTEVAMVEEHARRLEEQEQVVFRYVPNDIYPGMPYTTSDDLSESGVVPYSHTHISRLVRSGEVEAVQMGGSMLITPRGAEQLIERSRKSVSGEPNSRGGRPPGPTGERKVRRKQPRSSPK